MSEFRLPEHRCDGAGLPWPHGRPCRISPPKPRQPALPFELAAVERHIEHHIDPALLHAAARRAAETGVGGDDVLRAHGILSADQMTQALAGALGVAIDPLDDDGPPLSAAAVADATRTGVLWRQRAGRSWLTVAPQGHGLRRLAELLRKDPRLAAHLRITAPERLAAYLRRAGAAALEQEAAFGLATRRPDLSARAYGRHGLARTTAIAALAIAAAAYWFPHQLWHVAEIFLATAFLSWIGLRLYACIPARRGPPAYDTPDHALPCYSVIVPLYREARMVEKLVAMLNRLDYPREKLDIKLVCEADDDATLKAIRALDLDRPFELIIAPEAGPRTKPKALDAALPFVRGRFVVVYDVEDEPESDQLRIALAAYRHGGPRLACLQARLAIDNVRDNWLTRHFAAEYAGLFDVFLPVLAALRLPLPLGGTSNHFRTEALRAVGGWDPFNVTEDADLGMRLARFGYVTGVIDSTTYEEAPARTGAWLRQRTRWFKGWLQTWLVHMRSPLRLFRELGLAGFITFQLLVGGTALAALVHPIFLFIVLADATLGDLLLSSWSIGEALRHGLAATTLAAGYLGSAFLCFVGLGRRKLRGSAWVLFSIPLYWVFLSFAAWRGVQQLVVRPHFWEKTEHGLARTSRYGRKLARGALPPAAQKGRLRAAGANQPRPPRHFAVN